MTLPDDQGTAQEPEGTTEEPLGPPFPPVGSFTVAFEEPGVYPYFCVTHPWMTGQVIVRGDAQTEPGTQPSANERQQLLRNNSSSNATTSDTQDLPLSDPDAETSTPTPPSAGTESPNPIFG